MHATAAGVLAINDNIGAIIDVAQDISKAVRETRQAAQALER
nr:hypothetical protein [uncultured Lichenicoccus sp.]